MVTEVGDTLTLVPSLLVRSTVTPFPVAGEDSATVRVPVVLNPILAGPDMLTEPGGTTVTLAVASGMFGPLAWIRAVPTDTLVKRTVMLVELGLMDTPGNTVATLGLLDVRVRSMPPAGAGADSVKVRNPWFPFPVIVRLAGTIVRPYPTVTADVAWTRLPFTDLTVMVVVPVAEPYTLTWFADCVCPAAIVILAGDTVALAGSLVVSSRNNKDCAAFPKLIGNGTESPGETDKLAGTMISTEVLTVTFAVASVKFGALA